MKKKIFWVATVLLWIFIFWNSMQNAAESTALSESVQNIIGSREPLIRKVAHFLEFALLGSLMCINFSWSKPPYRIPYVGVALIGLLTACSDETIQIFSPGRSSQLTDVWLDFAGYIFGASTILALLAICKKSKHITFFD